jgi:DNA-binding NarL/FixJ family response regulator
VVDGGTGVEHRGMAVRVLIVDDHVPFRALARMLLVADGFDVVGEAGDGAEALRIARRLGPDVVVLDVQLPGVDGFGVAEALAAQAPAPAVVLVSSRARTDYGRRVDDSVARGFIAKAELSGATLRRVLDRRRAS